MQGKIYEEALADVKMLREAAVDDAKRSIVEAVTPHIREFIEMQFMSQENSQSSKSPQQENDELLGLSGEDDERIPIDPLSVSVGKCKGVDCLNQVKPVVMSPDAVMSSSPGFASHVAVDNAVIGSENGDAVIDIDSVLDSASLENNEECDSEFSCGNPECLSCNSQEDEYILDLESLEKISPVLVEVFSNKNNIITSLNCIESSVVTLLKLKVFDKNIVERLSTNIENLYEGLQRSNIPQKQKELVEFRFEKIYEELKRMKKENKMSFLKRLTEADDEQLDLDVGGDDESVDPTGKSGTLKITVKNLNVNPEDLEGATVELENDEDHDEDATGESDGDDLDLDSLDSSSDEEDHGDEENHDEDELTDESVLDIDENVIVKEIHRMKKLREASDKKMLGSFGGGEDGGDAWRDQDITTESEEGDEDEEDESDDKPSADAKTCSENVRRERILQKLYRNRIGRIRESIKSARSINEKRSLTRRLSGSLQSLKESRKRLVRNIIAESKRRNQRVVNETAKTQSNRVAVRRLNTSTQLAEQKAQKLQRELDEQKLQNSKLIYTTKLLQNESLSSRQKASVIERLDEAKSIREVRMTYEAVTKALAAKRSSRLSESKVIGSSSQPVRSSSSSESLNESANYEASRWAKLAGIK